MKFLVLLMLLLLNCETALAKDLVVVGAEWCAFCVKQKQFIKNNPNVVAKFNLEYIDADEHPEVVNELKVKVFPSSFIFDDNNKKIGELRGFTPTNFKEWIKKYE